MSGHSYELTWSGCYWQLSSLRYFCATGLQMLSAPLAWYSSVRYAVNANEIIEILQSAYIQIRRLMSIIIWYAKTYLLLHTYTQQSYGILFELIVQISILVQIYYFVLANLSFGDLNTQIHTNTQTHTYIYIERENLL